MLRAALEQLLISIELEKIRLKNKRMEDYYDRCSTEPYVTW